ncbi:MAG: hypothetical protein J6331_08830 [Lentisphaeria bacterium]|nr:hypothetical protein [Lentisphaeria bacterium]
MKTIRTLAAVAGSAALLTLAQLSAAPVPVEINGAFKGASEGGSGCPRWFLRVPHNDGGKAEFVKGENGLALKVTTGKKKISCRSEEKIKAKVGDRILVDLKAAGKGSFRINAYVYGPNGKHLSSPAGKKLTASEKGSPVSQTLKVTAKSEVAHVKVAVVVFPGSEITLEDVKVQYEAKDGAAGEKTAENKEKK